MKENKFKDAKTLEGLMTDKKSVLKGYLSDLCIFFLGKLDENIEVLNAENMLDLYKKHRCPGLIRTGIPDPSYDETVDEFHKCTIHVRRKSFQKWVNQNWQKLSEKTGG